MINFVIGLLIGLIYGVFLTSLYFAYKNAEREANEAKKNLLKQFGVDLDD